MKRRAIKIISLLLAITLCFGSFSYAFGAVLLKEETIEVPLIQTGSFEQPSEVRDYYKSSGIATFQSDETAMEYIYRQLLDYKTSFNIYSYKIPVTDFMTLYCEAVNRHPDLFYVSSSVGYNYMSSNNYTYEVTPTYSMTKSEIDNAKIVFENGVQKALSKVDSSMNAVQKCLVLHDYVCNIATYPKVFDSNGQPTYDKDIYHSAYGLFYDGNVVCAGYTLAYSYLLSRVGIETKHVTASSMGHAWNKVKINGNWYNVDLTFDDICYTGTSTNTIGAMEHLFFMKSDEAFSGEIGHYHFGGEVVGTANATDTSFDDYFWNDVDTFIPVINGDYYYLTPSSIQYLMKRTADGEESKVGTSAFSTVSMTFTSNPVDENGTTHELKHTDYMNRLVYHDNRFYINSSKTLYSYALMNGSYKKSTIYKSFDNYVVGLDAWDNEIVVQLYNDYDKTYSLNKIGFFNNYLTVAKNINYNNYADINLDGVINAKDYAMIKATK